MLQTISLVRTRLSQVQLKRLQEIFGEIGTAVIVRHIDDLEATFGSAAITIRMILEGHYPKKQNDQES